MKRQKNLTGYLLIFAAISFWISWFLMPDAGTADTNHILRIVKQSRIPVLYSVIIQIASSVLYLLSLFLLVRVSIPRKKTLVGIALFGIGTMGLCADAFFHLLAWFMTSDSVDIQQDVIRVMNFMQTQGLIFLIPLLLPFFIGSLVLAMGLKKQGIISRIPQLIFIAAFFIGPIVTVIVHKISGYRGPAITLSILGIFAAGQALIGFELMKTAKKQVTVLRLSNHNIQTTKIKF